MIKLTCQHDMKHGKHVGGCKHWVVWGVLSDDFCPDEASSAIYLQCSQWLLWALQVYGTAILMSQCVREGGRAGVGPPWSSFEVRTWLDMNRHALTSERRDHVVRWCNVYMFDTWEESGPAVSKLAIWPLPLYCLNESIWSEGVENVVPCGLLLLQFGISHSPSFTLLQKSI